MEPQLLSKQELSKYDSVEEMLDQEFGKHPAIMFTAFGHGKLLQPFENAKAYCELHGGTFLRTQPMSAPKLSFRPQTELHKEDLRNFERRTAGAFGVFQCIRSEDALWEVYIGHNGNRIIDPKAREGVTTLLVDVRSRAVLAERELRETERRAEAEAAAVRAEERRTELAETRRAEKAEQERREQEFRANLEIGDKSQCGYVIGMRLPMVEVAVLSGSQWFRVEDLVPAETPHSSCPGGHSRVAGDDSQRDSMRICEAQRATCLANCDSQTTYVTTPSPVVIHCREQCRRIDCR